MKTKIYSLFAILTLSLTAWSQGVGVNETGANPDASAILDASSTTKGFLPPRMTTAQRNAINTPAVGLMIFNITDNCMQWFDGFYWFNACTGETTSPPNPNLTVDSPTYQGQSVINNVGIGYNGETVPAASTITVLLSNISANTQNYVLEATDPTSGLQYSAIGTIAGSASNVPVVLNNNEAAIPWDFYGVINMSLEGANNTLNLSPRIDIKTIPVSDWVEGVHFHAVTNGGVEWMDRNLGAHRVATTSVDPLSRGNFYQWGRAADGHEILVYNGSSPNTGQGYNPTTTTLSSSDTPGHGNFITIGTPPNDWRSTQNNNLWQGVNGINNPCPSGYRIPTAAELLNERSSWSSNNSTGAFASPLKLPMAGSRQHSTGSLSSVASNGIYSSSTVSSADPDILSFNSMFAFMLTNVRALGASVRCIKD